MNIHEPGFIEYEAREYSNHAVADMLKVEGWSSSQLPNHGLPRAVSVFKFFQNLRLTILWQSFGVSG